MDNTTEEIDVLLVEDNPTDAELTIRALRKHNLAHKLARVKDGAEALDFIFAAGAYAARKIEHGPKVILLDLRLPKVDGMEVLRRVKGDSRTSSIPVVAVSSSKEDRDIAESYRLGVNSYISKPVEFDEFTKVMGEMGYYWLLLNRTPEQ